MISIGTLDPVTAKEISVQELEALGPDVRVVDVRETSEWESGHIAHAILVPLVTVPERLGVFDGSPNYVVCRSGGRSANACAFLADQGIEVVNVAGGMLAWTGAGFATETGASGTTGG